MKIEDNFNPFEKLDKEWALVTAGTREKFNSMTISWGGFGVLWFKNVVTIYIRPSRYTYEFLKENDYFTISFYDEEYRKDLQIMGSKSGRDEDKLKLTKLTPKVIDDNKITYNEANKTLVCKKLYVQQLDKENTPEEIREKNYKTEEAHYMFIGEIETTV